MDTADHELSPWNQGMDVETVANAELHHDRASASARAKSPGVVILKFSA